MCVCVCVRVRVCVCVCVKPLSAVSSWLAALGPELYSSVLSGAVVDWGSEGPGEEWVNTNREREKHGKLRPWLGGCVCLPCLHGLECGADLSLCGWQYGVKLLSRHLIKSVKSLKQR